MRNIFLIIFSILCFSLGLRVSDFKQGIFTIGQPYGFWNVQSMPLNINGQINLAYADFNSDKQQLSFLLSTDIVVIDDSLKSISIFLWNSKKSQFMSSNVQTSSNVNNIVSIIPGKSQVKSGDYNINGQMDLLIVYNKTYNNVFKYDLKILIGNNCPDYNCTFIESSSTNFTQLDPVEPFLIENDGTGAPSIVVVDNGTRKIITTDGEIFTANDFSNLINGNTNNFLPLKNHFASNVDFNGDCLSDLVLVSINSDGKQFLQFYEFQSDTQNYKVVKNISLTKSLHILRFADMNSDGSVDIIQILQDDNNKFTFEIIYSKNIQKSVCQKVSDFPFNFSQNQQFDFGGNIMQTSTLVVADANIDGYPDLLITLNYKNTSSLSSYLYINTFCSDCTPSTRNFQQSSSYQIITKTAFPASSASFFDLGEDGILDIIINVINQETGKSSLKTFINNLKQDSFFIKALPLSSYSSQQSDTLINVFGATFQWRTTTLQGNSKISYANQLSQQSHRSLQLPFISTGLGRTNNYIQDFTVGYSGYKNVNNWTPIIPNSKLIITPDGSSQWDIGVYVNPNTKIREVVIITIIILILIGIVILFLIRKQVAQDRNNPSMFFQLIR